MLIGSLRHPERACESKDLNGPWLANTDLNLSVQRNRIRYAFRPMKRDCRSHSQHLAATVLFLVALGVSLGSSPTLAAPRAVAMTTIEDVGRIDDANDVDVAFKIQNQGDSDLDLVDVVAACGCTVVDYDQRIVAGATGTVRVTLKPQGYSGALARSVRVYTNDAGNPYIDFVIKAVIAPSVYMTPGYARLVAIAGDPVEPAKQVIWAADFDGLEILEATTKLDFVELDVRPADETERSDQGSGSQWVVTARLTGTPPAEEFSDTVTIRTNHPRRADLHLPLFGQIHAPLRSLPGTLQLGSHALGSEIEASVRLVSMREGDEVEWGEAILAPGNATAEDTAPAAAGTVETSYEEIEDRYYLVMFFRDWPLGPINAEILVSTDNPEMPVLTIPVVGEIVE